MTLATLNKMPVGTSPDLAAKRVADLMAEIEALPNELDLTSPRDRHDRDTKFGNWLNRRGRLAMNLGQRDRMDNFLADLGHYYWRDHLLAAKADFTPWLMPEEGRPQMSRREELAREILKVIDLGPKWEGALEFLPRELMTFFYERNVRMLPGETTFFSGRGGLLATQERISEKEARRDAAQREIDEELARPL